jgi:hypothetical protein
VRVELLEGQVNDAGDVEFLILLVGHDLNELGAALE